jgi:hypothetical protein
MDTSLSQSTGNHTLGFSIFDQVSCFDDSSRFGRVLSADRVRAMFADSDALFGYGQDEFWNTGLTLWAFVGQVLQDGKQRSCNAAVTHATRYMVEQNMQPPSADSGEYCRARQKLDAEVLRRMVSAIAVDTETATPDHWRWHGKDVKLVDGFTFTMPDTPDNQAEFPQIKAQAPGVGFPIARACAVLSLANACIHDVAIGPYAGKETGETALLRKVLDSFQPGDVMLADRYFCSFFMLAIFKKLGVDACIRLHQLRKVTPSRVRWLGPDDYIDTWHKPQRARWMSQELYDSLPQSMDMRIVGFTAMGDRQTEPLNVATTFLDHRACPPAEIGALYGYRWHAELDVRSIKQLLNLDHLRCKSPDMIRRELWATLLAYNMVRVVCAQAAFVHDKRARRMSFTIACNTLLSQWLLPPEPAIRQALGRYSLLQVASNEVGDRPGRIEPRVVKRRPKPYDLMTKPRHQYTQRQA